MSRGVTRYASGAMRRLLCALVRGYQLFISPLLPRTCRFYPSCSEYMLQAITEYGVLRGVGKGLRRLLRCQPFCPGGYDPVKPMANGECRTTNDKCQVANVEHNGVRATQNPSAFSVSSVVRR